MKAKKSKSAGNKTVTLRKGNNTVSFTYHPKKANVYIQHRTIGGMVPSYQEEMLNNYMLKKESARITWYRYQNKGYKLEKK